MSPMFRVSIVLTAALAVLAIAPAAQARVPERFFGAMWDREAIRAPEAEQDEQWALMAESGVRTVRAVFWWSRAEPFAGQPFDFGETDADCHPRRAEQHPAAATGPSYARVGASGPRGVRFSAETCRRLHRLSARARASLRAGGIVLGPSSRAPSPSPAPVADLERTPSGLLLEYEGAESERLGARVCPPAQGVGESDRCGRPRGHDRARQPGGFCLGPP